MGIFHKDESPRETSKKVSDGKQAPRNLDKSNPVIKKAEAYADSIQKILKGWERNMPQIEKQIKAIAKVSTYDYDSKVYHAKRIIRKYGGDAKIAKSLIDKFL